MVNLGTKLFSPSIHVNQIDDYESRPGKIISFKLTIFILEIFFFKMNKTFKQWCVKNICHNNSI